jgi:hypothetical protein
MAKKTDSSNLLPGDGSRYLEVAGASEYMDVRWALLVAMLGSIALTGVATRRLCTR